MKVFCVLGLKKDKRRKFIKPKTEDQMMIDEQESQKETA